MARPGVWRIHGPAPCWPGRANDVGPLYPAVVQVSGAGLLSSHLDSLDPKSLLAAPPRFQQAGEVAAFPQLGNMQLH